MTAESVAAEPAPVTFAARPVRTERGGQALVALLPAALTIYLSFESGGYFPSSSGLATLVVTFALIARILIAEDPFAGVSKRYVAVTATFAAYTGWTLVSALWSHAEGPALTEFARSLLYLQTFVLFGSFTRSAHLTRWVTRAIAFGAFVVCGAGLLTRVLPRVWPVQASFTNQRLSFPLTYWNALGLLASIGILVSLGLASNPNERRSLRALAAAAVPVLAATLLLTLSRGAIGALIVGAVIFVLFGRSVGVIKAAIAVLPTTAVAVVVTYHASLLTGLTPTSHAAAAQGQTVAEVVAAAALVAAAVRFALDAADPWVSRVTDARKLSRASRIGLRLGLITVVVAAVIVAVASGLVSREYNSFAHSATIPGGNARLTSLSSDGRTAIWRAAIRALQSSPLHGTGAGTFSSDWLTYRRSVPSGDVVVDAHNLYLQTLAELGVVGLILLAVPLLTIMVVLMLRVRGPERALHAGLLAAATAWCIHGAIDWDWQMPAVSLWFFAVGGLALAADEPLIPAIVFRELRGRVPLALGLLVSALAPGLVMLSENHLQHAASAFQAGNCASADAQALASIGDLAIRSQPYQILGYCQLHAGRVDEAVTDMQDAVTRDPRSSEYQYSLAIAEAYAGTNPRPALRTAMRLDPGDTLYAPMLGTLKSRSPEVWLVDARDAAAAVLASNRLTLS